MQILRKNVRVDQIICEGDLADIQAHLNKFVEKPTETGIAVALELFPIVVKSNQKGKFKLVAGHRTFLLARSRLISDEKIPVSELTGKGDDSELFGPASELFGALFFSQSADSLANRLEPYRADRSLALVARDLNSARHFEDIFKGADQKKKRTRRSKARDPQEGSEEQQPAPEASEAGPGTSGTVPVESEQTPPSGDAEGSTATKETNAGDAGTVSTGDSSASNVSDSGASATPPDTAEVDMADPASSAQPEPVEGTNAEASTASQPVIARRRRSPRNPNP